MLNLHPSNATGSNTTGFAVKINSKLTLLRLLPQLSLLLSMLFDLKRSQIKDWVITSDFITDSYFVNPPTAEGIYICPIIALAIGVGTGGAEGAIAPPATIKGGRTYRSAPPLLARINFIHNPKYRCVWCQLRSNIRKHNQLTCTTLQ